MQSKGILFQSRVDLTTFSVGERRVQSISPEKVTPEKGAQYLNQII
jgi:hypothetical protein